MVMTYHKTRTQHSHLRQVLEVCRGSFVYAGVFSLFVNLLMLTPAIYMLSIYDRVLASGSESTLLMLTLIVIFLFIFNGGLEWVRAKIMIAASTRLDQTLGGRVFDAIFHKSLTSSGAASSTQPLHDMLQLRQFLTGPGLIAFFDAPWLPIYVILLFLFHPYFGLVAVVSIVILCGLAIRNEQVTREDLEQANLVSIDTNQSTQRNLRNAEVIEAMGMLPNIRARWQESQKSVLALQARASDKAGLINSLVKTFRLTIQSLILGLGAYLAIHNEITAGMVVAGSILLARAIAPLDLMIGNWRGILAAREAYNRLNGLLESTPVPDVPMPLPAPQGKITVTNLFIMPPGIKEPIIKGISLSIEPGTIFTIIGPSAAGKSTLARSLLGIYPAVKGSVRFDGAEIQQWDRQQLGRYVGYLPQDVELLDGTISENIARFDAIDPLQVVKAAQTVGIHEMILKMPQGYETRIVSGTSRLSSGQQQRIGIARALYGAPQIIVLDEPNSNLDQAGDAALVNTLMELKKQGRTVIVVTHRSNMLDVADRILMLVDGQAVVNAPRDQALAALDLMKQGKPALHQTG